MVDMKNANYSHTWTDIDSLTLKRTYNSRSLHNGLFGFGWCSDYESILKVTPEGNLKIVVCGGGNEVEYVSSSHDFKSTRKTIKQIMYRLKKSKKYTKANLKTIAKRLEYDTWERERYAKLFNIERDVKVGAKYIAYGRSKESIVLKDNVFKRSIGNGSYEKYNLKGQLTYIYDRNGNYFKIAYKKGKIYKVSDNNGKSLTFSFDKKNGKVKSIAGPNNAKLEYRYKGEDLVYSKNSWKNSYTYEYDDLHNLTKVNYPDKTSKTLTYDKDKDWVTSFKDRKNCLETYVYEDDKKNPLNHYWSRVQKKCGKKITNKSSYEFEHRKRADGSRYLHRTAAEVNGKKTEVIYHDKFGKPIRVRANNAITSMTYYETGELKTKSEPFRTLAFYYENKCRKVSKVTSRFYQPKRTTASNKGKAKKLVKTINTSFSYQPLKCNLITAINSTGQKIKLKYDKNGRIASMIDQARKSLKITYDLKVGKPKFITRPGIGTIQVSYDPSGKISKVESKEGPLVATQVAGIFSNLLEIISPASSELGI